MDDLPELWDTKLGEDASTLREICQSFDGCNDLLEESFADLGDLKFEVPGANFLQIMNRRSGEADPVFAGHVRRDSIGA
jgi:hypothetical protein